MNLTVEEKDNCLKMRAISLLYQRQLREVPLKIDIIMTILQIQKHWD
jgi:hypothetical protein